MRATAVPLRHVRTGSSRIARASIWRPASAAAGRVPSAATRAWAIAAPASTAIAAASASVTRPPSAAAGTAAASTTAGGATGPSSSPATSANSTRWRGCALSVSRHATAALHVRRAVTAPARAGARGPRARRVGRALPAARGARRHNVTSSRSDASRFSPMPGISPSSSIEPKPPLLLAELEDLLRGQRTDPAQRVELLERRRVEVERLARGRRRRARVAARRAGPARATRRGAFGHQDLAAVLELRREVQPAEVRAARRAARALHRVVDPRARAQPVDPGLPHGARDVDHEPAAAPVLVDRDRRRARRRGDGLPAAAAQLAEAEHDHQAPRPRRRARAGGA